MADVHCPLEKRVRPMRDCLVCNQHKEGTSLEWCGYRQADKKKPNQEQMETIPLNALEMQLRKKLGKAEYFYRTGKTRIAENLSHEAAILEFEIRRMKKDERQDA